MNAQFRIDEMCEMLYTLITNASVVKSSTLRLTRLLIRLEAPPTVVTPVYRFVRAVCGARAHVHRHGAVNPRCAFGRHSIRRLYDNRLLSNSYSVPLSD